MLVGGGVKKWRKRLLITGGLLLIVEQFFICFYGCTFSEMENEMKGLEIYTLKNS
jgi:hypothetical protein